MTTNNATTATPFLATLDAITLDVIWQQTFHATASAYGLACGVADDELVYMAGIVKDGGIFDFDDHSTTSLGQDDVFVVQVSSAEGNTIWFQQLGTLGNDRLAHGSTGLVLGTRRAVCWQPPPTIRNCLSCKSTRKATSQLLPKFPNKNIPEATR
jgi:hypothetical protein